MDEAPYKLLEDLKDFLVKCERTHFWVDGDNWYSCPKAPDGCADEGKGTECTCGADEFNEEVRGYSKRIEDALIQRKNNAD